MLNLNPKNENKPRIKLEWTAFDQLMEMFGLLLLVLFWTLTLYYFASLPDVVPTHFNIKGEPDAFGSKWTMLWLPSLTTIIYAGLTILNKFPHKFNYAVEITEQNASTQYLLATRLLRMLKTSIIIVFGAITYMAFSFSTNNHTTNIFWLIPTVLILTFIPIIIYFVKSLKSKK